MSKNENSIFILSTMSLTKSLLDGVVTSMSWIVLFSATQHNFRSYLLSGVGNIHQSPWLSLESLVFQSTFQCMKLGRAIVHEQEYRSWFLNKVLGLQSKIHVLT